jgi:hypothetical protein|tara:strand:+ start:313 stop:531 length:219 start_codon:yes stop_codon:yes gene_type:complete
MFKALVTICIIAMPNTCQTLEDTRGPYETKQQCKERALQISRQVHKYYPLWKPVKYKCKELPVGRLRWKISY